MENSQVKRSHSGKMQKVKVSELSKEVDFPWEV